MASGLPEVLQVTDEGDGRYAVNHPSEDPEARNVVFSGQVMAQKIMAADHAVDGAKEVKSIHSIFARAGVYTEPMSLELETIQSGRAWASQTTTARQGERLLSRSLVLLNTIEPDLMRHSPTMPDVPRPADLHTPGPPLAFPGAETRMVEAPEAVAADGSPEMAFWMRYDQPLEGSAANQAVVVWSQPGHIIGLAMRPHASTVRVSDAHRTISTGVISHTCHFHEAVDVSRWLLIVQQAVYAGRGRVLGTGSVFSEDGTLVSTFSQDSMVRGVDAPLDPRRSM